MSGEREYLRLAHEELRQQMEKLRRLRAEDGATWLKAEAIVRESRTLLDKPPVTQAPPRTGDK